MATKTITSYRTLEANSMKQDPLLCYEVWYTDDKDQKQMVAAYWDVMVAWRVMEAINASSYGNLGVAEVAVVNGMEEYYGGMPITGPCQGSIRQPRTDVLNEQGIRSQPNEQKYEAAKREFEQLDNDAPDATDWANSPTPPPEGPPTNIHEWRQFDDGAWGWRFSDDHVKLAQEVQVYWDNK